MKIVMIVKDQLFKRYRTTKKYELRDLRAWMRKEIFLRLFHEHFDPAVRKHIQACLPPKLKVIQMIDYRYISRPNVTAAIQPMHQGIF